jgi:hypothetical protein
MMTKTRPAAESAPPIERAFDRCAMLEAQLAETHAGLIVATADLEKAANAEDLAKVRSRVDFAETRTRVLIEQRVSLEPDRLAEIAADVAQAAPPLLDRINVLSGERHRLAIKLDELEYELGGARHALDEARRAATGARRNANIFTSADPRDRADAQRAVLTLRARLESLGR